MIWIYIVEVVYMFIGILSWWMGQISCPSELKDLIDGALVKASLFIYLVNLTLEGSQIKYITTFSLKAGENSGEINIQFH